MKTLKKALALVLALALCLSLATVAFAANYDSYADASEVSDDYAEAVDVVVGLKIIEGKDGNKLDLSGTLQRAEAAKILAVLNLGTKLAASINSSNASTGFSDTKGNWASGYIAYNVAQGYLTGSNGKFDPTGELTGTAFGKMLLNVLGYGLSEKTVNGTTTTVNKYEGSNWAINVLVDGNNYGLFTGVKSDVNGAITRADAMQMVFNALKLNAVASAENAGGLGVARTYALNEEFAITAITGAITANAATTAGAAGKQTTLAGAAEADDAAGTYKVETGVDLLGHYVKLWTTVNADASINVVSLVDLSTVVTVSAEADTAAKWQAAFGETAITNKNTVAIGGGTLNSDAKIGTYVVYNNDIKSFTAPVTYVADKVNAITTTSGSESITLAGAGVLNNKAADGVVRAYEGIAKDDIVVYSVNGAIYNISKATTVEGKISKISGTTYTINGVDYKASAATDNSGIADASANFSDTFKLYLTPNNEYFAIEKVSGETAASNVVYVVDNYSVSGADNAYGVASSTKYYAQAVDTNGTEVSYEKASATAVAAGLYTVSVNSRGIATFTAVSSSNDVAYGTNASATLAATDKIVAAQMYYASGVKFIYVNGSLGDLKITTKTGPQALSSKSIVYYGTKANGNGTISVVYVLNTEYVEDTSVDGTGIIAGFEGSASTTTVPYTMADGSTGTAYVHSVYIDGVKTDIQTDADTAISGYYTYKVDSVTGLYTVAAQEYTHVYAAAKLTNNYNGLITNDSVTNLDVTGAKIVNTTNNEKADNLTALTLTTDDTVSVVCDKDDNAVIVYVTASDRT
jgi:hypothetical protein